MTFSILLEPSMRPFIEAAGFITSISKSFYKISISVSLHSDGFPGSSNSKESACNAGDLGSIPVLGRSSREGNGNPLQYSS